MKKTTQYIAMAALTFSIAACTQDDTLQGFNDPNAVCINAAIGHLQSRVTYEASGATFFSTGDAIKVENTQRTTKNIATYTTADGSRWTTEDAFVWNSGTEANNQFQAWYPVTASFDAFELPTDQSDATKLAAADWMTASTAAMAKPAGGVLDLNFTHKLAKVTVNISPEYGAEYDAAPTFTDVKIYTYDGGKTIQPLVNGSSYTAIVTPGYAYTTTTFMTLKANGVELTVKPTATLTAEGGLATGSHYTFTLKVGKDAATISEVTVGEWDTTNGTITDGGMADEVKVISAIEGSTATITVPELATDAMVQNAVTEALADNATLLMINGQLTDAQQTAIATALTGKSDIALVMGGVTAPTTAVTELTGIDLAYKNGTGENGHVVVADGYIVTSKAGLDAWKTAATSDVSTNLTLACDIEYNASWSMLDITYSGTIDGNGYAIIGLNCSVSESAGFIYDLGGEGVIKYLGIVGGSFSNSKSTIGCGSRAFVSNNYGVIMGCYNTSSCTSAGGREDYGYAAGFSVYNETTGKIIACYNTGTISAGGSYGSGISCYNKGVISGCYNTGAVSGKGESLDYYATAITSVNRKTINDCYYTQPSRGYETDPSYSNTATATNITNVASSDWTDAMNKMNAAIEAYNADEANTVKCNYRYAINTDAATKSAQPLVIVEASATE